MFYIQIICRHGLVTMGRRQPQSRLAPHVRCSTADVFWLFRSPLFVGCIPQFIWCMILNPIWVHGTGRYVNPSRRVYKPTSITWWYLLSTRKPGSTWRVIAFTFRVPVAGCWKAEQATWECVVPRCYLIFLGKCFWKKRGLSAHPSASPSSEPYEKLENDFTYVFSDVISPLTTPLLTGSQRFCWGALEAHGQQQLPHLQPFDGAGAPTQGGMSRDSLPTLWLVNDGALPVINGLKI